MLPSGKGRMLDNMSIIFAKSEDLSVQKQTKLNKISQTPLFVTNTAHFWKELFWSKSDYDT
jgi:hypothetical protein